MAFFIRLVEVLTAGEAMVIKRCKTLSLSEGRVSNPPLLPYLPRLPQVMTGSHAPLLNILVSPECCKLSKGSKDMKNQLAVAKLFVSKTIFFSRSRPEEVYLRKVRL